MTIIPVCENIIRLSLATVLDGVKVTEEHHEDVVVFLPESNTMNYTYTL